MADADGKMRIEKLVVNNKNKTKTRLGFINCITKTFLSKTRALITLFGQQRQKKTKFRQIKKKTKENKVNQKIR